MKHFKQLLCLTCAAAMALNMAGCSSLENIKSEYASASSEAAASSTPSVSIFGNVSDYDYESFNYSDGIDSNGYFTGVKALDYVTLPDDVASITVPKSEVEPSSDDVQEQIDALLSNDSTTTEVTDRAVEDGDTVNIDYSGTVNGVAFTGGTASGYGLTIGSGTFIDGFEDQIIGHKPGETIDVNVTFPDGYGSSTDANGNTVELSNADAVFSVKINYIAEETVPELTDEWVDETYGESDDIHSVAELEALLQQLLYDNNLSNYVMDYLMENSTFSELPKAITDYQVKQCLSYYSTTAGYYNYTLDELASGYGFESADAMLASMDDSITEYTKEALVYQAVAEQLNVKPTQEQIDNYSVYTEYYGENYCHLIALMDAVSDTLVAGAKDASGEALAENTKTTDSTSNTNGVTPELKEWLDSYETFMDKYVTFMQSYKNSNDTASLLSEYMELMQEYATYTEKLEKYDEDSMSAADLAYYTEVTTRVAKKLLSVSLS